MIRKSLQALFALFLITEAYSDTGAVYASARVRTTPSLERAGITSPRIPASKQAKTNLRGADDSDRFEADRQSSGESSAKFSKANSTSSFKPHQQRRQSECRRLRYPEERFWVTQKSFDSRCDVRSEQ